MIQMRNLNCLRLDSSATLTFFQKKVRSYAGQLVMDNLVSFPNSCVLTSSENFIDLCKLVL
jgi:hypothetical protein